MRKESIRESIKTEADTTVEKDGMKEEDGMKAVAAGIRNSVDGSKYTTN